MARDVGQYDGHSSRTTGFEQGTLYETSRALTRESHMIQWFAPNVIDDSVFRTRSVRVPLSSTELFTGTITAASTFGASISIPKIYACTDFHPFVVSGGKHFIVVGTEGGVYLCVRGELSQFWFY